MPQSALPLDILELVPSAICVLDAEEFRVEWANAAYRAFAPGKSLIGLTWDEIWAETGQKFTLICRRVLETGEPHIVVDEPNEVRRGPGEPVETAYFSWSLHRVKLPGRSRWNLIGTAEETTARMRATIAQQHGQAAYRGLFMNHPQAMWVYHRETLAFLEVNDAAVERYGYSRDEFLRMTLADIRPPEDVPLLTADVRAAFNVAITAPTLWRHRTKAGRLMDVEITSHVTTWLDQPARLVLALDVTERVRAEAQLRESELLNRVTVEHAAVGINHVTPDGRFTRVNSTFCDIVGYTEAELLSLRFHDITYADDLDADVALVEGMLSSDLSQYTNEKRYVRKDGTLVPVRLTVSLVRDKQGAPSYFISIVEDISARLVAESERERLQAELLQAQKLESVGKLAGGVAHDFNNMLNVILGYADMALQEVDPQSSLAGDLREIATAAKRSASITSQLLAFARKQPVVPQRIDLNATVEDSLKMLRRLLGEELTLKWEPGGAHWPVLMDPMQLHQVLANLATNARDAIDGPGTLTIRTRERTLSSSEAALRGALMAGDFVELEVSDNGPGIASEVLPHVFEPFFTTKEIGRGTGLGLATVFGIVAQNHGHIEVTSPQGKGATFSILFPRASGAAPLAEPELAALALPRGTETVLVVEDEPAVLRLASTVLESLGYRVLRADRPSVALRLALASPEPIELILSDIVMPEQRGPTLVAKILTRWPLARVLFMSGYPGTLGAEAIPGAEVSEILPKPFSTSELARRVRAVLDAPHSG